jgi:hypothetical protein
MPEPVLLNNVDHHDLRVMTAFGAAWGDAVNEVTVFATEFESLSREYPIIFRRDRAGAYRSTILLGFERGENLYLDGDRWSARSVPALLARGPFSIGLPADGQSGEPMIHIALDHPRISREEGQRIFLEHGGNAPYLEAITGVLRTIYAGSQIGPAMIAAFDEAGLFEQTTLQLDCDDGRRFNIPNVWTLSAQRFAALDGDALARLHSGDFLRCAVWVISSLGNVSALLDRKLARGG